MNSKVQYFSAINKNTEERMDSSSGGIFSLLCHNILRKDGVVYGAAYDENQNVYHCKVTSEKELYKLRGAKYSQSSLQGIFPEVKAFLDQNTWVLFSGTPCQVAGLKKYLAIDYDHLITVDIICHGVPVEYAWTNYLEYRRKQDRQEKIASTINMRSKSSGWSRYGYSVCFKYNSGYEYSCISGEDSFMFAFVNNMILKESCFNCRFKGIERLSDFTLGDFWGVWDYKPHMDDDKGTSLVIIHSDKGRVLWEMIQPFLLVEEISVEQASAQNPSLFHVSNRYNKRDVLLSKLKEKGWGAIEEEITNIKKQKMSKKELFWIFKKVISVVQKLYKKAEIFYSNKM